MCAYRYFQYLERYDYDIIIIIPLIYDITEIQLKVALNTITLTPTNKYISIESSEIPISSCRKIG
jgi:hypothetical protein